MIVGKIYNLVARKMGPNKRKAINIQQNLFTFFQEIEVESLICLSSFLPFLLMGGKVEEEGRMGRLCEFVRGGPLLFTKAYFAQYSVFSTQWWDKKGENIIPLGQC